ncbi:hypothetical protein [Nesterenkonia alba]|uniref:hypothetical protein n=1 Tax=Nesterenkonia alba TaxID=515814 RepID=UPI0003FE53EB|nr:hypothetical protein [Nesterenkonia alba]
MKLEQGIDTLEIKPRLVRVGGFSRVFRFAVFLVFIALFWTQLMQMRDTLVIFGGILVAMAVFGLMKVTTTRATLRRYGDCEATTTQLLTRRKHQDTFTASDVTGVCLGDETRITTRNGRGGSTRRRIGTVYLRLRDGREVVLGRKTRTGIGGNVPLRDEAEQVAQFLGRRLEVISDRGQDHTHQGYGHRGDGGPGHGGQHPAPGWEGYPQDHPSSGPGRFGATRPIIGDTTFGEAPRRGE